MKYFRLIVAFFIMLSFVNAVDFEKKALDYKDKVINDISKGKNKAIFNIGVGYVDMTPTYDNIDFVTIENNPLLMTNIGITILPDTLNLSLNYSNVLDDSGSDTSDVEYTEIYMKPFKTSYGDFGFGYKKSLFNTKITNTSDYNLSVLDLPSRDGNYRNYLLKPNEILDVQTKEERYIFGYNLPKLKYIPDNFGFQYSIYTGYRPLINGNKYITSNMKIDNGTRIDIGVFKTKEELEYGLNVRKFVIYIVSYDAIIQDDNPEPWSMSNEGYNIELVYKGKLNLIKNIDYLLSVSRDYLTSEEVIKVYTDLDTENGELSDDKKKNADVTHSIYFELNYKF